ncbi:MAG: class B sortase [Gracilibacteraceae bacterium]|jgi:sortase B|nr:class B sortase [Gracilibacteraceae bacterium]
MPGKRQFQNILTGVLIVAALILGGNYIYEKWQDHQQVLLQERLRQEMALEAAAAEAARLEAAAAAEAAYAAEIEKTHLLETLQDSNPDTVAWLEVEGTPVLYPVTQTVNNDYYLKMSFQRQPYKFGSIYMDYRNDSLLNDFNTIIYGHTFPNDETMFGALQRYRKQSFWDEHHLVTVMLDKKYYDYEIFAVYVTEPNYDYRTPNYRNEEDAERFLREIREKSLIKSDIPVTAEDHVLTLSTCTYDFRDARYAVHAVRIAERDALNNPKSALP